MSKESFVGQAGEMYEALREWRTSHPQASFDEIAAAVQSKRQELMGGLLGELAQKEGVGSYLEERECPECGGVVHYKGERRRQIGHSEGEAVIERGYHYCDQCGYSFFPSG